MVWGCASKKSLKFLVFSFSFLAFICGMASLIAGVVALKSFTFNEVVIQHLHTLSPQTDVTGLRTAFHLAIGVGSLIMFLSCLGCYAAWRENQYLLCAFASMLLLMVLIQLIAGILAFTYKGQVIDGLRDGMIESAKNVGTKDVCDTWKAIQNELNCCGPIGEEIPSPAGGTTACDLTCPPKSRGVKCPDAIVGGVVEHGNAVGGISIGFLVLEFAAIIFACWLCQAVKHGHRLDVQGMVANKEEDPGKEKDGEQFIG